MVRPEESPGDGILPLVFPVLYAATISEPPVLCDAKYEFRLELDACGPGAFFRTRAGESPYARNTSRMPRRRRSSSENCGR